MGAHAADGATAAVRTQRVNLGGCSSLPDSAWNDEEVVQGMFSGNRWRRLFPVYCIRTSDGRYGTLTQRTSVDGEQGPLQLEYVLWKKPGD